MQTLVLGNFLEKLWLLLYMSIFAYLRKAKSTACIVGLLFLCSGRPGFAQTFETTFFDTLLDLGITKIKISTDLDSLEANRLNDSEILATFEASDGKGQVLLSLPTKLSVRSRSRRRYCSFPPLKLNFSKTDLGAIRLSRDDEYKVVTHCLDETSDESHLLKEYLVYEFYQLLTPISLSAVLVDMEYHCVNKDSSFTRKAVILESFDELARKK